MDDAQKATVPIKLIREACSDLYIRPNEGNRKIYIFPRAQALRTDAQNALLKCIEEPPAYGVFIFLCDHAERMLPTVRSRCAELRLSPLRDDVLQTELQKRFPEASQSIRGAIIRSGGYLGQAIALLEKPEELLPQSEQFVKAFCDANRVQMLRLLASMEKLKREQLKPIFTQWYELLSSALSAQSGLPAIGSHSERLASARTTASILSAVFAIQKAQMLLEANVGTAHLCGALAVELQA